MFNGDASQTWATPQYTCSSGNCTFEPITTIAAQARCHNLTDLLQTGCDDTNNCTVSIGPIDDWGLSMSYRPGHGGQLITIGTTGNLSAPHAANSNPWNRLPIIQYIMVQDFDQAIEGYEYYDTRLDTPFLAAECEVNIVVQAIQDSITNAEHSVDEIGFWRYGEPVTTTTSNTTLAAWWRDLTGKWDSSSKEDLSMSQGKLVLPPGYKFGNSASVALSKFMQSIFDGTFSAGSDVARWATSVAVGEYAATDIIQSFFYGKFSGCAEFDDHLSCGVKNMAKAMTKTFRDNAYVAHGLSSANVAYGETQVVRSYVHINWFWFSLSLSVWTMAAVLWISTVVHTRRMKVSAWANNILPLLFLYRGDVGKEEVGQQGTSNADYLRKSERIAVQLRFSDGKAKLE
jgi:hypothetical protein